MKPFHASHSLARWSLEVDIDKYHNLIPVCLLGLTVFEKMQWQNNTDNQVMMNEGNKCFSPLCYNFSPTQRGAKILLGGEKKLRASRAA